MKREINRRLIGAVWLALGMGCPATARAAEVASPQWIDGIAAVVGSRIVTWSDVVDQIRLLDRMPTAETAPVTPSAAREALIEDILVEQEAARDNISISPQELDETVEQEASRNGVSVAGFRAMIEQQGTGWDDYLTFLRKQLVRVRLIQRRLIANLYLSESDLRGYYRRNEGRFRAPAKYYLFRIEHAGPPRTADVMPDVAGCRTLADPADCLRHALKDRVAPNLLVVDFGWISPGELKMSYRLPLLDTRVGGITPDIAEKDTHISWYVRDLVPAQAPEFDKIRPQIEEMAKREELERRFRIWVEELMQKTFVKRMAIPPEFESMSAPATQPVSGQP